METRSRTLNAPHTSANTAMADNNENNNGLNPQFIRKLADSAQARITTKLSGTKNYHKFMLEVNFAIKTFEMDVKTYDADHILDDKAKCKFAYNNFGPAPNAWFTIAATADDKLMEDWEVLDKALKDKYDDKNREFNAYVEWRELRMGESLDDYEARYDRLLTEKANQPSAKDQVMHYLSGLQYNLRTQVMSTFVRDKADYTLEAAKSQARVFYTAERVPIDLQKRPINPRAKVQFKVPTTEFEMSPQIKYRMDKEASPMLAQNLQQPFAPDVFLRKHNAVRSTRYPDFFPNTLRGQLSHIEGSPGHKLRLFCAANNLCNFCRCPGHHHNECAENPNCLAYKGRSGN